MLYAYFSLIFERISVKLGCYISSISSINPMNFQVRTLNVMVTVRQNNSSIHPTYAVLLFSSTISQDLFNPCPWMFRPRIRMMGHPTPQFRAKADLPVGFPYRFNSSWNLCFKKITGKCIISMHIMTSFIDDFITIYTFLEMALCSMIY